MVDHHGVNSCTLSLTLRGLITYVCLWVVNLQSFNHSMGKEIQSNILSTLSKLATMQARRVTLLSNNLFIPYKGMFSIGILILSLNALIIRTK